MSRRFKNIQKIVFLLAAMGTLFLVWPFKDWSFIPEKFQLATISGIFLFVFGATFILARSDDKGKRLSHGCAFGTLVIVVGVVITMLSFILDMDSWR